MQKVKHWQDPVNAVIGAWLVLSPWALGFQAEQVAMWNAIVVGVLLVAVGLGATFVPRAWEEWTEGVLGIWMILSPWVLAFANVQIAMINAVVVGVAVVGLALWVLMTDAEFKGQQRSPGMR
ncbi:MAG: SPW repeat protein [Rhizobacter sp.]|nr:SPW repeat protein [Rhizobacter sp.]